MKYNDTQKTGNNNIEIDDMNIKSHLNTSLDLSGITVSEDLINRTLAAIKEQPAKDQEYKEDTEKSTKKVIIWSRYARGFAGVAAAALIIAIGYGAMTQMSSFGKKESANSTESPVQYSLSMDTAEQTAEDADTTERTQANEESTAAAVADESTGDAAEKATQYGIAADTLEESAEESGTTGDSNTAMDDSQTAGTGSIESENGSDGSVQNDADTGTSLGESKMTATLKADENSIFTFRDIFLPDPVQAYLVTITDDIAKVTVTLTEQADISDFYTVMDNHQFTEGTEAVSDQSYTVEVKSLQNGSQYIMLVGDHITVHYTEGDTSSESFYDESGDAFLKTDLAGLILKYSN